MQTITVRIKDGEATIETKGFRGTACKLATADLERAIGASTTDTPTPEAFLTDVTPDKIKLGGGR